MLLPESSRRRIVSPNDLRIEVLKNVRGVAFGVFSNGVASLMEAILLLCLREAILLTRKILTFLGLKMRDRHNLPGRVKFQQQLSCLEPNFLARKMRQSRSLNDSRKI